MTVLHLPTLQASSSEPLNPAFVADLKAGKVRWQASWPEVLAMAVRDGAASVHYHPWRSNGPCNDVLSYVVTGTRWGLIPPGDEAALRLFATAKQLAAPNLLARLRAWIAGGSVNRVRLVAHTEESEWCVVCWGRGRLAGVEFFRLTPMPAVETMKSEHAKEGEVAGGSIDHFLLTNHD